MSKLFVGNLPYSVNEEMLQDLFDKVGAVVSTKVITDRDSGRSKGFGFVEMENATVAEKAISELNGEDFMGRPLVVNEARPQQPRSGGGESRGRY